MTDVCNQVPNNVIAALKDRTDYRPSKNELVALIDPTKFLDHKVKYAYARLDRGSATMTYEEARIDATATPYPTGKRINIGAMQTYEVGFWETKPGDKRVTGPVKSTFPQMKGWKIGKTKVSIDNLSIKKMCTAETRKKFVRTK